MLEKLTTVERRFDEIDRLLADPEVSVDYSRVQTLAREQASIRQIASLSVEYRRVLQEIEETTALIREESTLDPSPHVLRADDPPPDAALRPAREIETDSGPHISYAIQWFSFAIIALAGTAILIRKDGNRTSAARIGR